jgi:hypothetical protein
VVSYRLGEGSGEGRSIAVDHARDGAGGGTPALLPLLLLLRLPLLLLLRLPLLLLRPQLLAHRGSVIGSIK